MNNKFIINANGIKKEAEIIVKFNHENKDYLIYCTDENESNKQIFVSRLTLNSEGKYFIDDITLEEKNKLNGIVYNIVILIPNEAKKGIDAKSLIERLVSENKIELTSELPALAEQNYYNNCSIAITSKLLVEEAISFFKTNLVKKVEEPVVPTWSIPTPDLVSNNNELNNINPTLNVEMQGAPIPQVEVKPEVQIPVSEVNIPIENKEENIPTFINNIPSQEENIPNPQAERLAVVSDPSLNSAGLNLQPNVARRHSAGNANTKYIILGTVCLVLAVAVVVITYFLIKNMK